jgi:hypothetical protein
LLFFVLRWEGKGSDKAEFLYQIGMLVSSILVKAVFLSWIKPSVALNFRSPTSKQFCRKMSASFAIAGLPRPPSSILTDFGRSLRKSIIPDMEELQAEQTSADDTRDSIFRQVRKK